jgi:hypothetical protein
MAANRVLVRTCLNHPHWQHLTPRRLLLEISEVVSRLRWQIWTGIILFNIQGAATRTRRMLSTFPVLSLSSTYDLPSAAILRYSEYRCYASFLFAEKAKFGNIAGSLLLNLDQGGLHTGHTYISKSRIYRLRTLRISPGRVKK